MSQSKGDSQFVWTKLILLFGGVVASVSFLYLTYWSFGQTWDWFSFLDFNGGGLVSLALALVFQYGQGPVIYLRMRFMQRYRELNAQIKRFGSPPGEHDGRYLKYSELVYDGNGAWWTAQALSVIFFAFAAVDGWTNIDQMWFGLEQKALAGIAVGQDKYFFTAIVGVVLVFVEELIGLSISMSGNLLNDIRQIYGMKRLLWLDMFGKLAEEQLSGRGALREQPEAMENRRYGPGRHTLPVKRVLPD
jgi:hypothetical protein